MIRNTRRFWLIALSLFAFSGSSTVHAICAGATVQGTGNCLFSADFSTVSDCSTVSGTATCTPQKLLASNMFPFQRQSTEDELQRQHDIATNDLGVAQRFRDSMTALTVNFDPTSFTCPGTTIQQHLFCEAWRNYETEGYVETDWDNDGEPDACDLQGSTIGNLIRDRDTFAYQIGLGWFPTGSSLEQTKVKLRAVLRTLTDLYLLIADEFFIDGTEFRVAYTDTWSLDNKLDAQIKLVTKSRLCYAEAVNSFVYGFSPAVGTNIYASESFDADLMGLFNLTVDRWSSAWREESSKRRVRGISSSASTTAAALANFKSQLRDAATPTYLLSAALAKKQGSQFAANGGDRLKVALDQLRMLESAGASGLNPLGYDDRFVPLRDFSPGLYEDADAYRLDATASFAAFERADSSFRYDIDHLLDITQDNANSVFRQQLEGLTGVPVAAADFIARAAVAANDFANCGLDLENAPFVACMQGKATGALAAKYHEMHRTREATNLAISLKDNALAEIESENRLHNSTLEIENQYNTNYRDTVTHFTEDLRKARTIVKSESKGNGTAGKIDTTTTTTSYDLRNDKLGIDLDAQVRLQEVMRDYRIALAMAGHDTVIQRLLNDVAAREIEIGLAIQAENAAALDFGNLLRQRDSQVLLLQQAIVHAEYSAAQAGQHAAEMRILRSQAALRFGSDLNQAVRFAYLAAKSLEYKYLRPLVDISIGGMDNLLNLTDLYKIQDVGELQKFLAKLDRFDTCGYGLRQKVRLPVSLAKDIVGLTDAYLNPNGTLSPSQVEEARAREWQGYLYRNLQTDPVSGKEYLRLTFSTSLANPWMAERGLYNMKIWYGVAAPPCDPVFTGGVAIHLDSQQTGSWQPYVTLSQEGATTLLDRDRKVLEYQPVNEYLNLVGAAADEMFSAKAVFDTDSGLYTDERPPNGTLWNNGLKGRSLAASNWVLEVRYLGSTKIAWKDIADISIHFDVLGTPLP